MSHPALGKAIYIIAVVGVLTGCGAPVPQIRSSGSNRAGRGSTIGALRTISAARSDGAAALLRINNEAFTPEDLWRGALHKLAASRDLHAHSEERLRDHVSRLAAQLLRDKIAESLLYQQATLRAAPAETESVRRYVETQIRRIITTEHGGVQRRFEKKLDKQGLTLEQLQEQMTRELTIARFLELHVKPKTPEPTRAQLVAMFEQNKDQWHRVPRRRMSLIEVSILDRLGEHVPNPTREEFDRAKLAAHEHAQAALAEIRSGEAFDAVCRRYSDGLSRDDGGQWGWVTLDSVRRRFLPAVQALFLLEEGQVSDIIDGDDVLFIVRCDEISPGSEPHFESAQPQLRDEYMRRAHVQRVANLIEELRASARIEPADLETFHKVMVDFAMNKPASRATNSVFD